MIKMPGLLKNISIQLGLATLYFLAAYIALKFATLHGNLTLIWPSSGIALASVILLGEKYAIGIFAGALAAGIFVGNPFYTSLIIAIGNTLEPLLAVYLLRFLPFAKSLYHIHDYRSLLFAGFIAGIISALHGSLAILLAGFIPYSDIFRVFFNWWASDCIGILLFAPFILLINNPKLIRHTTSNLLEFSSILLLSSILGLITLTDWQSDIFKAFTGSYLLAVPLFWAIIRFGQTMNALIVVLYFIFGVYGLLNRQGIFIDENLQPNLPLFWVYFFILSIVSMVTAYINNERKALFQAINNNKSEMYMFSGSDMHFEFVNKAALNNLQTSYDKALSLSATDLINPSSEQQLIKQLKPLLENRASEIILETTHIDKDHSSYPAEIRIQRVVRHCRDSYLATVTNISERKEIEAHRALGNQVCDISPQAIMITDKNNKIIRVNEAFTKITGYTADEVHKQNPEILNSGRHNLSFYLELWATLKNKGSWQGEIYNRRKNGELYLQNLTIKVLKNSSGKIENYIAMSHDITHQHEQLKELKHRSEHDVLTDLPNRNLLQKNFLFALANAKRHKSKIGLLYLDLNNFKPINDNYSHTTGDILLQIIAGRLQSCVRESDMVARIGGDEFVILLTDVKHQQDCQTLTEKLKKTIAQTISIHNINHQVTTSIGIAIYPENGLTFNELLHSADVQMYQDKQKMKSNELSS